MEVVRDKRVEESGQRQLSFDQVKALLDRIPDLPPNSAVGPPIEAQSPCEASVLDSSPSHAESKQQIGKEDSLVDSVAFDAGISLKESKLVSSVSKPEDVEDLEEKSIPYEDVQFPVFRETAIPGIADSVSVADSLEREDVEVPGTELSDLKVAFGRRIEVSQILEKEEKVGMQKLEVAELVGEQKDEVMSDLDSASVFIEEEKKVFSELVDRKSAVSVKEDEIQVVEAVDMINDEAVDFPDIDNFVLRSAEDAGSMKLLTRERIVAIRKKIYDLRLDFGQRLNDPDKEFFSIVEDYRKAEENLLDASESLSRTKETIEVSLPLLWLRKTRTQSQSKACSHQLTECIHSYETIDPSVDYRKEKSDRMSREEVLEAKSVSGECLDSDKSIRQCKSNLSGSKMAMVLAMGTEHILVRRTIRRHYSKRHGVGVIQLVSFPVSSKSKSYSKRI